MLTLGCLGLGRSGSVGAAGVFCRKPHLLETRLPSRCDQPPETRHHPELLRQSVMMFGLSLLQSYTVIGASGASILIFQSLFLPANTWSGPGAGVTPLDHGQEDDRPSNAEKDLLGQHKS